MMDELLEKWSVLSPGEWENEDGPADWFAVCNEVGIVAYFGNATDAYRWRWEQIGRELNP